MRSLVQILSCFALLLFAPACRDRPIDNLAPDAGRTPLPDLAAPPAMDLAPAPDIAERLRAIPGMTKVVEVKGAPQGYRFFHLELDQPADHGHPEGRHFAQRLTLLHRSTAAPVVLASSGYFVPLQPYRAELTILLEANQISVEHRYFTPSRPDPPDWSLLTIQQAAADYHRITLAFKPIYGAPWINTGASKGGMTSVFHRRFYPDDVAATVAYVAPLSLGAPDPRYVPFVNQAGHDPTCRQRLQGFQRTALSHRDEMLARMSALATKGTTFATLGPGEALEHAVLELPFAFWQYQGASLCPSIPGGNAPANAIYDFLDKVSDVASYGDADLAAYGPYYYQAATQFGFPAIDESSLSDLLDHPGTDLAAAYAPKGVSATYDPQAMIDIDGWVKASGRTLLFIYGSNDPWSAGAFELGGAADSYRYFVPDGNHGSVITALGGADRSEALATVKRWAGAGTMHTRPVEERSEPLLEELAPRRRL